VGSDKPADRSRTPGHGEAPRRWRERGRRRLSGGSLSEGDPGRVVLSCKHRCAAITGCRKEESTEPSLHEQNPPSS
jgi:hypothetical protein